MPQMYTQMAPTAPSMNYGRSHFDLELLQYDGDHTCKHCQPKGDADAVALGVLGGDRAELAPMAAPDSMTNTAQTSNDPSRHR